MGVALELFGKDFAEAMIAGTSDPVVGLFIGTLATSLIQSSSSTTSITVVMVGSGALTVPNAIPIIMGANIGTSVTNTLVALVHIRRSQEFRRSLSASTVHDFFNLLSVLVCFPLQYLTNFLGLTATFMAHQFQNAGGINLFNPVKTLTKPVVHWLSHWIGPYPWMVLALSFILILLALNRIVAGLRVLVVKGRRPGSMKSYLTPRCEHSPSV